jgi:DNA-binding response OmpR family regulator
MRVLQVEDDSTAAQAVEKILESKGYACETTAYGELAVELATQNDYDIILLDIMLPDIDGYEVLRRLQAAQVHTPVLIQSGIIGRDELEKGAGFGVDDYLVKPFTRSELAERIETALQRPDDTEPATSMRRPDKFDRRAAPRGDDEESRRQQHRKRTLKSGQIVYNNANCIADCLILNLSEGGAALQAADFFDVPSTFVLKVHHGETYRCEVCWQLGKKLGVRFVDG